MDTPHELPASPVPRAMPCEAQSVRASHVRVYVCVCKLRAVANSARLASAAARQKLRSAVARVRRADWLLPSAGPRAAAAPALQAVALRVLANGHGCEASLRPCQPENKVATPTPPHPTQHPRRLQVRGRRTPA